MPHKLLVGIFALLLALPLTSLAQNKTITGKVTNEKDGTPLPGISVTPKGGSGGTSTSGEGTFSITIPASTEVLVFSGVGFDSRDVNIAGQSVLNVTLKATTINLNEVVVIGYGTQRRREVTGAISKVSGDKITALPTPSFEASLQGRAPGVQVIQGSGLAGSGSVVRIRGVGSISAGGDPLYVVDGVPIVSDPFLRKNDGGQNQNPLATINPNDIESIEVLKDAGSAGIYGSRGANGVILITTKKGKSGKPRFNYNNRFGFSTWAVRQKFLDGPEWLQMRQEAWENDGHTGKAPLPGGLTWDQATKNNTDWWDLLTRTGFINDHNLSMTAGNNWLKSYVAASYGKDESYIKGNAFERLSLRGNFDFQVLKNLKIMLNTAWNRGNNLRVPAAWAGGIGDAMQNALPIYPVYNADGTYFKNGMTNPVFRREESKWRNTENKYIGQFAVEYQPIKDLTLRATANIDYTTSFDDRFESALHNDYTDGRPGIAKRYYFNASNMQGNFTATYNWNPNENSRFSFMGGTEAQEYKRKAYNSDIFAYTDKPFWKNKSLYKHVRDSLEASGARTLGEVDAWTFVSFFGRINYTLKNRYVLQVLGRADGSSKFGPNNKYGFFPAASAAWIITEEDFAKNINWLRFLKLRASYGVVGNADIPSGAYYSKLSPGDLFNGNPTLYPDNIGNPDLKWETMRNVDVALEFSILNNRISGEVAYYRKTTIDQLLNTGIMYNTGFKDAWRNLDGGKIQNEGIEFSITAKVVDQKDFSWTVGGNISRNSNKVISIGQLTADAVGGGSNDTRIIPGYPVGTNYLVRYVGVDPSDGLPIWLDVNGKTTKTFSLDHRVPVGSVIPDYVGGFNSNWSYKGFDLGALFTFAIGGNIYDGAAKRQAGVITDWVIREDLKDRWRKPGDEAKYPRLTMNTSTYAGLSSEWQYNSTMFLYSASFLRLRELTLNYNFPSTMFKNSRIRGIKAFVTGMNLLTFSKFPGGDPEIARDFDNPQDRNMSPNVTYLTPPQQKSVSFGVNVNF
ncbi:TonB-dependent receptor [Pseudoflavitalea sp. G-6-1-2]|uniref:SusC/RagA family TonB-linked outer membrane protein n=1 Tax=Pseudoflavitalea sp. G-6-1-2 TaxID=2728841 RepID=UPI001469FC6A|nr:TonB-dependent receptor [Pseudoflavitalea sp. G-6-1-2]NML20206.1 TonB-dependent receptor [Pseudoflavitalea sp. G-6-1-2]